MRPTFIFQNNSGFTHVLTDGSYSWVMPTTTDYGVGYLASFYEAGMSHPSEQTVGVTYKGFNDTLASWGSNRIMGQQCGQTWLETFSKLNSMYSAGNPLPYLQLVTWNDYEEATELESGIDNCVTLSGSVAANSLQWTITGEESTVDHYAVYISSDGQNLMPLTDMATGIHSLNLCGFPIPNGTYQVFVQAIGKPNLANQITGAMNYAATCVAAQPPTPILSFSASPVSVTIPAGASGSLTVSATPQSGSFNSPISLSCSGIPNTLSCAFYPAAIIPGSSTATSTLTISAVAVAGMNRTEPGKSILVYASCLMPFGLVGFGLLDKGRRRRGMQALALCGIIGMGMIGASCGSARSVPTNSAAAPVPTTYTVTIQGSSSASQLSTTVNVIVQ
jgi:hypothetical protein